MHTRKGKRLGEKVQYGGYPSRIFGLPCFNCALRRKSRFKGRVRSKNYWPYRLELVVSKLFQHSNMHKNIFYLFTCLWSILKSGHCWYLALVLNLKPIQGNGFSFKQQYGKYCASMFLLLRRNDFKRFSLSLLSISLGRNLQFHKAGSLIIESLPLLKETLSSRLMKWIRRKYPESI